MLEHGKAKRCYAIAELSNHIFLYVVQYKGRMYVYNITKMKKNGYDFKWTTGWFNKTTDFHGQAGNREKVEKKISYLPFEDAAISFEV